MNFTDFIDQTVILIIPRLHPTKFHRVIVKGIEGGGIWIQNQNVVNAMLQAVGQPSAEKTPVIFLPFHEIAIAIATVEGLALDEKAFGL
jgi:hypothetical protein